MTPDEALATALPLITNTRHTTATITGETAHHFIVSAYSPDKQPIPGTGWWDVDKRTGTVTRHGSYAPPSRALGEPLEHTWKYPYAPASILLDD